MKRLIMAGGLGNQMFEYAFLLALRKKGYNVVLDISYYGFVKMHNGYELNRVFGINEECINSQGLHVTWLRFLQKYRPSLLYTADKLSFDPQSLQGPRKYIGGYWQDEQYFKDISKQVRSIFTFKAIDNRNEGIAQDMRNQESVSLHIRRGDYAIFGMSMIGEDYYRRAVSYINSKVLSPHYYIFTDDEVAAKKIVINLGLEYTMINHNRGTDSYKDMYLMSQCRHNIIANSSFSWWGAWLNRNEEKFVIAPVVWEPSAKNFHPQANSWILI